MNNNDNNTNIITILIIGTSGVFSRRLNRLEPMAVNLKLKFVLRLTEIEKIHIYIFKCHKVHANNAACNMLHHSKDTFIFF